MGTELILLKEENIKEKSIYPSIGRK